MRTERSATSRSVVKNRLVQEIQTSSAHCAQCLYGEDVLQPTDCDVDTV